MSNKFIGVDWAKPLDIGAMKSFLDLDAPMKGGGFYDSCWEDRGKSVPEEMRKIFPLFNMVAFTKATGIPYDQAMEEISLAYVARFMFSLCDAYAIANVPKQSPLRLEDVVVASLCNRPFDNEHLAKVWGLNRSFIAQTHARYPLWRLAALSAVSSMLLNFLLTFARLNGRPLKFQYNLIEALVTCDEEWKLQLFRHAWLMMELISNAADADPHFKKAFMCFIEVVQPPSAYILPDAQAKRVTRGYLSTIATQYLIGEFLLDHVPYLRHVYDAWWAWAGAPIRNGHMPNYTAMDPPIWSHPKLPTGEPHFSLIALSADFASTLW